MSDRPMVFCAKCGQIMTPDSAKIHPEFFLHDRCLPEELKPKGLTEETKEKLRWKDCCGTHPTDVPHRCICPCHVEDARIEGLKTKSSIMILYRNHKGMTAYRNIIPIRFDYGSTKWHPDKQWLVEAVDVDKGKIRTFAYKDILEWKGSDKQESDSPDNAKKSEPNFGEYMQQIKEVVRGAEGHLNEEEFKSFLRWIVKATEHEQESELSDNDGFSPQDPY